MRAALPQTLAVLATGALVLTGCSTAVGAGGASGPSIVATTTQVADFTRELVGEQVEVTQLVSPNRSAHDFDPSAAQLLALSGADALVVNGAGLESWLDDVIDASGFSGTVIDASTGVPLLAGGDHDHDEEDDDHADEDDDHAGEGSGNPHIWTDPVRAAQMVENIASGLAEVDGIRGAALSSAEDEYLAQLDALDAWIHENVDVVPAEDRLLVTNHDAFTYFVDAYDITYVGSIIPGFDDNAEPSAAELDALIAAIRETGARAVFSEQSIPPDAARTIATEAGVTVYDGDDALYGDSLGVEGSDGETYLGSQVHNVRLIAGSWGVDVTDPPSVLGG